MGVDGAHNHRRAEADEKKRSVDGKGVGNGVCIDPRRKDSMGGGIKRPDLELDFGGMVWHKVRCHRGMRGS